MMPLVWLLNMVTRVLMRMVGIKADVTISSALSKDELRTIVNESRSQISRRNQDMLLSVLDLEKVSVDDIMVPQRNRRYRHQRRLESHRPPADALAARAQLYRDSLDDAISMLRARSLPSDDREKEFTQRDAARRRRNLLRAGRNAAQHAAGEIPAQERKSGLVVMSTAIFRGW
jgi:Mg2+/Co2+ transporter CorB